MKTKILGLVGLVAILAGTAGIPSCTEEQRKTVDKVAQDANAAGKTLKDLAESPAATMIPPEIRLILGLLGTGLVGAAGLWQEFRSKIKSTTLQAVADAIDAVPEDQAAPVKKQIAATMRARGVYAKANKVVDDHRSKLAS